MPRTAAITRTRANPNARDTRRRPRPCPRRLAAPRRPSPALADAGSVTPSTIRASPGRRPSRTRSARSRPGRRSPSASTRGDAALGRGRGRRRSTRALELLVAADRRRAPRRARDRPSASCRTTSPTTSGRLGSTSACASGGERLRCRRDLGRRCRSGARGRPRPSNVGRVEQVVPTVCSPTACRRRTRRRRAAASRSDRVPVAGGAESRWPAPLASRVAHGTVVVASTACRRGRELGRRRRRCRAPTSPRARRSPGPRAPPGARASTVSTDRVRSTPAYRDQRPRHCRRAGSSPRTSPTVGRRLR